MGVKLLAAISGSNRARDAGGLRPVAAARCGRLRRSARQRLGHAQGSSRPGRTPAARRESARQKPETPTDLALVAMASAAAGDQPDDLLPRRPRGTPGKLVNATIWTILALRPGRSAPVPPSLVRGLPRRGGHHGGWPWLAGGAADWNNTAADRRVCCAVSRLTRHHLPPATSEPGWRLRADARARLRPTHGPGGPWPCSAAGAQPRPPSRVPATSHTDAPPNGRDRTLGLGDLAGAACARAQAVPPGYRLTDDMSPSRSPAAAPAGKACSSRSSSAAVSSISAAAAFSSR